MCIGLGLEKAKSIHEMMGLSNFAPTGQRPYACEKKLQQ